MPDQREIKFRAWDTKDKYWLEPEHFYITGKGRPFTCQQGRYAISCRYELMGSKRYIVEFWTGLADRNGTEIFEGDKIRLSYGIPPTYDTLVIEYADDEVVADISVSGWWMRNTRPNGCSSSLCKTYESDIEVIGNIHQNPELVNDAIQPANSADN